ncbi:MULTISPECIES: hypothetical protein [Thiorhodovibrio]|uniref:hypothetical protein n=1 Tax=Thiorhodovibrio TaxID=61593 RepID=UPI001912E804|nr:MULTISPECIES: hypothetical protein [Thiorhodovibrio]MBK5970210.1 hypothetical protein [Thiorhodovibrio winogradskyi]WPL13831.1 hypothetical protein Thiosp_03651 [Thiorhodovibrio litoralis]
MKRKTWIFLSLACLTLLLGVYYDPFIEVSPSLIENGNFSAGLQSWKIHAGTHGQVRLAEDGSVLLRLRDSEKSVGLRQKIDTRALQHRGLRLSGTIRTRQVAAGQKPWQNARVMMNTLEPDGARVGLGGNLGRFHPSQLAAGTGLMAAANRDGSVHPGASAD